MATIVGTDQDDLLLGDPGGIVQDDLIQGLAGDDVLDGGSGGDVLSGGAGADTIRPGDGADVVSGGSGADLFVGTAAALAGDRIADFEPGDVLRIEGTVFTAADLQVQSSAGSATLRIDTDRNGSFETVIAFDGIVRGIFAATPGQGRTDIVLERENRPPVVSAPIADQALDQNASRSIDLAAVFSDPDGDRLDYGAMLADGRALPNWVALDAAAGTLGLDGPGQADVGRYEIVVTASDQPGSEVSDRFVLTVVDVNDPPMLGPDAAVTVPEDARGTRLGIRLPTDADGDAVTVRASRLPDPAIGRVKFADGTPIVAGQAIPLADLPGLIFESAHNANGAAGALVLQASDGRGGVATQTITIDVSPTNDPPMAGPSYTVRASENGPAVALDLPPPSDPDGDALYVSVTAVPSKGRILTADGREVRNPTTLDAAELAGLVFVPDRNAAGSAGTFAFRVQDNQGGIATQTITFEIAAVDRPPAVTAPDVTLGINQALAASTRFSASDPEGDAITAYRFSGGNPSAGHAYWTLDGVAQTAPFVVAAADLARVGLRTGSVAGVEELAVAAYDGYAYGADEGFTVTVTGGNAAPTVVQTGSTAPLGGAVAISTLFDATDPNGPISYYEFRQVPGAAGQGYLTFKGERIAPGAMFAVPASQLSLLSYTGGSVAGGVDQIQVWASDGELLSGRSTLSVTAVAANRAPVASASDRTLSAGATAALADLVRASDPDGDPVERYEIVDRTPGGAALSTGGTSAIVTPGELAGLGIVAGAAAGSDTFTIRAFDGTGWGPETSFTITTRAGADTAPVVAGTGTTVGVREAVPLASLIRFEDPDGDPIAHVDLEDLGGGPDSGYLAVDGQPVAAGSALRVGILDLSKVHWVGAAASGATDTLRVSVSDGALSSVPVDIVVGTGTVNRKPVVTAYDRTLTYDRAARLSDLFRVEDADGDSITQYRIRYVGGPTSPGYISLNGKTGAAVLIAPSAQEIVVKAADLGSLVVYANQLRGATSIQIEAFDGTAWSDPVRFAVLSRPKDERPAVTQGFATVGLGEAVAATGLIEAADPEGAALQRYTFVDNNGAVESGYLVVDGVRQAQGASVAVAGADVGKVRFVGGAVDGAIDVLGFRVSDGAAWSDWGATVIGTTSGGNRPPEVAASSATVGLGQRVALSSLVGARDPAGDKVAYWRIADLDADPNSATIVLSGSVLANGSTIVVSAADFAKVALQGAAVRMQDEFRIEAFDGEGVGGPASLVLASRPENEPPKVTVRESAIVVELDADGSVTSASVPLSDLFDVSDPDGDAVTRYQFFDSTIATASSYVTVNGTRVPAAQIIDVLAAQMPATEAVAARDAAGNVLYGQSDLWWVRAYDGTAWSEWQSFTVTVAGPDRPPAVQISADPVQLRVGTYVQLRPLLAFSDPDGDPITRVRIADTGSDYRSAYLFVNGKAIRQGESVEVPIAQLDSVFIVAGQAAGVETFTVEAYDGKRFGEAVELAVATRDGNMAPVVAGTDTAVQASGGLLPIGPLIAARDPDGDGILKYQIYDANTAASSGYITVDGVRQPQGATFEVDATRLSGPLSVAFIAGSADRTRDVVYVRAWDGLDWGEWSSFTITSYRQNTAPMVSATDRIVGLGASIRISDLFGTADAERDGIVRYRFIDGNADPGSAVIRVAGVGQAPGSIVEVGAADLAKVTLGTADAPAVDPVTIQAFDGIDWSQPVTVSITSRAANGAPDVTVASPSVTIPAANQAVRLSDLFTASDPDGDPVAAYQLQDTNAGQGSGYLEVGGARQPAGSIVDLMASELASARFVGAAGSAADGLLVRAGDGTLWGEWQRIDIRTLASV